MDIIVARGSIGAESGQSAFEAEHEFVDIPPRLDRRFREPGHAERMEIIRPRLMTKDRVYSHRRRRGIGVTFAHYGRESPTQD